MLRGATRFLPLKPWLLASVAALVLLSRVCLFAADFGSVEHDSGWFTGVARVLAEHGVYASYVNRSQFPKPGISTDVFGRPTVQDDEGFEYFNPGITVGPGYVVPQAILFEMFGAGWWQNRLWPLLSFGLLLCLSFRIALDVGGVASVLLLGTWLWIVPQFTFTQAYESFAEQTATAFALCSAVSFCRFDPSERHLRARISLLFSGLLLGIAVQTKLLCLLFLAGMLPLLAIELFTIPLGSVLKRWTAFGVSFSLPTLVYEGYRYGVLTTRFGEEAYAANNEAFAIQFQSAGSGIGASALSGFDWSFAFKKWFFWHDLGIEYVGWFWVVLLVGSAALLVRTVPRHRRLCGLLILFSASNVAWFVLLSPLGWFRHVWFGAYFGMLTMCLALGLAIRMASHRPVWRAGIAGGFLLVGAVLFDSDRLHPQIRFDQRDVEAWNEQRHTRFGLQGLPTNPIFSLSDQREVVEFFRKNVRETDEVFGMPGHFVPEIALLADHIIFPLGRHLRMQPAKSASPAQANEAVRYLILGPYQLGDWPWQILPQGEHRKVMGRWCDRRVFRNRSYGVCVLRPSQPGTPPSAGR